MQIGGEPIVDFVVNGCIVSPMKRERGRSCLRIEASARPRIPRNAPLVRPSVFSMVAIIHLFEITQRERGAVKLRQSRRARSAIVDPTSSCQRVIRFGCFDCFVGERNGSPFSEYIVRAMARDRGEPGWKFFRIAHAPARFPGFDQRVLHRRLRLPRGFAECRKRWRKVFGCVCE